MTIEGPRVFHSSDELPHGTRMVEAYEQSLHELFFVRNPRFKKGMPEADGPLQEFLASHDIEPIFIYYPWRGCAVRTVPEEVYFELRTSRNKNIVTNEEQARYRGLTVGIAGLSVGSAILHALTVSGGPKRIKIADFDVLEVSNLNRIRATLPDVGMNKTEIAARNVWEIDPFAELVLFSDGLTRENIERFLFGEPRLDIFIDEMDSIPLKLHARVLARAKRMPVCMATDNGDGMILDVERFDEDPEREIFHGALKGVDIEHIDFNDFREWVKVATKIVGPEYLPARMRESIEEIGKSIAGIPQLGTSASVAGAAMAFVARKIANKESMPSGRYVIDLEAPFLRT